MLGQCLEGKKFEAWKESYLRDTFSARECRLDRTRMNTSALRIASLFFGGGIWKYELLVQ